MVLEKGLGRQPLSIHSEHQKSTTIFSRSVGEDEGDFLKPLLIKSKVNKKKDLKRTRLGKQKNPKTFLRNHHKPVPRTRAYPCISREQARGARRKQLLRQFDGKGASES